MSLSPVTLQPGQCAKWPCQSGLDINTAAAPITSRFVSVNDYAKSYVGLTANNPPIIFFVQKQAAPQGGSYVVTVTEGANDAAGNPLPSLTRQVTVVGPPAPPLAVSLTENGTVTVTVPDISTPHDPGSGLVTF